jgi:hypothetical protein
MATRFTYDAKGYAVDHDVNRIFEKDATCPCCRRNLGSITFEQERDELRKVDAFIGRAVAVCTGLALLAVIIWQLVTAGG